MLLRESLGEVHQVPSRSALLPVRMNAQAVNDQCPSSLTLPRQWPILVRLDIIQAHGGDALAVLAHHEQRARAHVVFDYSQIGIDLVPLVNALSAHVLGAERDNLHHARCVAKVCSFNMSHHVIWIERGCWAKWRENISRHIVGVSSFGSGQTSSGSGDESGAKTVAINIARQAGATHLRCAAG